MRRSRLARPPRPLPAPTPPRRTAGRSWGPPGARAAGSVAAIAATALADQATKWAALSLLSWGQSVPVLPGVALTLSFNEGASFGILSQTMAGRPRLMAALTGAIALIVAVMALRAEGRLERAGLVLIAGGALGNIVDRLRQGAVTDFLDLSWRGWHGLTFTWPTFNGADIAITLGALLVLHAGLVTPRRGPAS